MVCLKNGLELIDEKLDNLNKGWRVYEIIFDGLYTWFLNLELL